MGSLGLPLFSGLDERREEVTGQPVEELRNPLIPMGELTMRRSPTADPTNRLADDPFDLCVIDISQETAQRITASGMMRCLSLGELDPWADQDLRDSFTVAGFPGVLQDEPGTDSITASICFFTTFLYGGKRGNVPWSDADRGVGILVDYGDTTTESDDGQRTSLPDPRGMSGGGMWRIAQYGCDMANWSLADVKLIGIQSCFYTDQLLLRGTRIEHHLGCIYRGHEDLRPEFDRIYGPEAKKRWLY